MLALYSTDCRLSRICDDPRQIIRSHLSHALNSDLTNFAYIICAVHHKYVFFSSCLFGGTCVDDVNSYRCSCAPGFTGSNCQHRINPCDSRPCLNGATCTNKGSAFECHCPYGFTGPRCESFVNWCAQLPCMNGATCIQDANQFQCICRRGYTGVLCDVRMVSCSAAAVSRGTSRFKCFQL